MITDSLPRLVRFDLDFDLPEHILPDRAPPIYLTTRPDLGDVSKGRLITIYNYYEIFNGKGRCVECHPAPYYTDNNMHNLKPERFYKLEMVNGMMMAHDGMIKTFPLRGIKDSPPYLHDGRCFTLEDVVEYFNLIQELRLTAQEKASLVAFMVIL